MILEAKSEKKRSTPAREDNNTVALETATKPMPQKEIKQIIDQPLQPPVQQKRPSIYREE